ncbi:MAG: branched-chain amino acid ABC transporter permease [Betaproteobacteria bacterium]|nr:MAG: branched-chain amino acid ABC transporter permease [Betaproteobacteria bacterium]
MSIARPILWSVALLALAALPFVAGKFYIDLIAKIMIMAIFAMSLDLLVGVTGLVSLGHAAFFGLASYMLVLAAPDQYTAVSLWTSLPLAMAASALLALVIGALVLRTRGVYFIMVTLAFSQMVYFVFHDTKIAGGSDGTYIYVKPNASIGAWSPFNLGDSAHFYYAMLALLALTFLFLRMLLASRFGRALRGIKSNEQRMRALGFNTYAYKLAAFTIAGAIAGLAGYFAAVQFGFVNPEMLSWHQSANVLLMVILGGMGNLVGAVVGAFALVLAQDLFSSLTKHWLLLMGGFVIAVVVLLPNGLTGAGQTWRHWRERTRSG